MSLTVLKPGQHTSVQDLGRPGHAWQGVTPGGAADPLALRIANRLAGNADDAAGLEITLVGPTLRADRAVTIALAGAQAGLTGPGRAQGGGKGPLLMLRNVSPGEEIAIGPVGPGARVYLSVRGGVATQPVLGSRSAFGAVGLGGGPLRAGDVIPLGVAGEVAGAALPDIAGLSSLLSEAHEPTLLCTPGPHFREFSPGAIDALLQTEWTVGPRWDRMGLRLEGPPVAAPGAGQVLTEAALPGFVQVPEGGAPIILGPDAPVTGGYPVALAVASVSLPALGQLRAGSRLRLALATVAEAGRRLREREARLDVLLPTRP